MKVGEILSRVRANYGEKDPLLISDEQLVEWLDTSIRELFVEVPPNELRTSAEILDDSDFPAVALVSGLYGISEETHHVYSLFDKNTAVPLRRVTPQVLASIDLKSYSEPLVGVYSMYVSSFAVRPTDAEFFAEVLKVPDPLDPSEDMDKEVTSVPKVWHSALVHKLTYLLYAQEEDVNQAHFYHSLYQQMLEPAWNQAEYTGSPFVQEFVDESRRRRQRGQA